MAKQKSSSQQKPFLLVIDPAVKRPEISSLKLITSLTKREVFYHLPSMSHFGPLLDVDPGSPLLKGIVILGSAANMNERLPWKTNLVKWIDKFLESGVPILGICFGHQMIASIYGAKVNYALPDKTKYSGFRKVELLPDELWGGKKKSGHLVVSHCQIVRSCPQDLRITAFSSEVAVEGLRHHKHPLWTFQPHPEATYEFIEQRNITAPANAKEFQLGQGIVKSFVKYCD